MSVSLLNGSVLKNLLIASFNFSFFSEISLTVSSTNEMVVKNAISYQNVTYTFKTMKIS